MVWRLFAISQLERWMIDWLLANRFWRRGVGKIHDTVQRVKHGAPSEDVRVTHSENDNGHGPSKFFEYFKEEIRDQLRWNPREPRDPRDPRDKF